MNKELKELLDSATEINLWLGHWNSHGNLHPFSATLDVITPDCEPGQCYKFERDMLLEVFELGNPTNDAYAIYHRIADELTRLGYKFQMDTNTVGWG